MQLTYYHLKLYTVQIFATFNVIACIVLYSAITIYAYHHQSTDLTIVAALFSYCSIQLLGLYGTITGSLRLTQLYAGAIALVMILWSAFFEIGLAPEWLTLSTTLIVLGWNILGLSAIVALIISDTIRGIVDFYLSRRSSPVEVTTTPEPPPGWIPLKAMVL